MEDVTEMEDKRSLNIQSFYPEQNFQWNFVDLSSHLVAVLLTRCIVNIIINLNFTLNVGSYVKYRNIFYKDIIIIIIIFHI